LAHAEGATQVLAVKPPTTAKKFDLVISGTEGDDGPCWLTPKAWQLATERIAYDSNEMYFMASI
jgi:hypothetical protein